MSSHHANTLVGNNKSSEDVAKTRQKLSRKLQLHGYSACQEALLLLEDHYTSSCKYNSLEDFINLLNRVITFETFKSSSVIDSELAYAAIEKLKQQVVNINDDDQQQQQNQVAEHQVTIPSNPIIKLKNVQFDQQPASGGSDFEFHYNFLYKKLNNLSVFQKDFQLMKLATLTASSQPSIRCICFGLLIKDISKIDGYLLIDGSGRVPVRITPDTTYRNKLAYSNCIVLVEGVYVNPDDVLFAANIGLPPILLDPIQDKTLACRDEKMIVILKEIYLDEDDVCNMLEMLFTGYNSMEDPPALFILVGDFSRKHCDSSEYRILMKRFIRILRTCENLKSCHFVFVPGQRDTSPQEEVNPLVSKPSKMPKQPLTKEQFPVNLLQLANFPNIHLATNPAHIYIGDRLITIVAHNYFKELMKNILHDMSDHNQELFDTVKQLIISNGHLSAGIDKHFQSSMNLWNRPDLLVLADTLAFGNKYEVSISNQNDTSFTTLPSFSRQSSQFKVYYLKTGEIEESQVSSDALESDDDEVVDLVNDNNVDIDQNNHNDIE